MNRRDFLKAGALGIATVGTTTSGSATGQAPLLHGTGRRSQRSASLPAKSVKSVCNVCFWRCGIAAELGEDGRLLHIRGNAKHPLSNGRLCPRGVGGAGLYEDSDRLGAPRIRRGPRAAGVFRDVGWPEALKETATLLRKVIDEDGPGAIAFLTHGMSDHHFGHLANAIGTPHQAGPAYGQCKGPRDVAFKLTFGHMLGSPEEIDLESSRCVVLLGSHLGENMHNSQVQELIEARARGAHLIVVDPRRSTVAEKADRWLQIAPGTDMALLLSWMHILIRDEKYDASFVSTYCSGFEELEEHVKKYTPEWASSETGLSIESIESTATMIAQAGPEIVLHPGRHVVWHGNDTQRSRALAMLVALTGSWGAKGGYYVPRRITLPTISEAFEEMPNYPAMDERRDPGFPFGYAGTMNGIRDATLDGKIKAWVVAGTNLLHAVPGEHETRAAIAMLDALIVVDILPTETAMLADVLLPAASYLEHDDYLFTSPSRDPFVAILQRVMPPVEGSRCESKIARGIGEALGLGEYFPWKSESEYVKRVVDKYNSRNSRHPIDLEELRKEGAIVFEKSGPIYRSGHGLGQDGRGRAGAPLLFPEWDGTLRSNRVRLYSPDLELVYREKLASKEPAAGFEPLPTYYRLPGGPPGHIRLTYGRSPLHSFSRTQNSPSLYALEPENAVWISPATARAFGGLEDGQWVRLMNQDGVEDGPVRLKVTARVRNDVAYMTHGHGHNSRQLTRAYRRGGHLNRLTSSYVVDPLCGATAMRVNFIRITRA